MSMSMMIKLKCGEPKPTQMTSTIADIFVIYPYGVLEDILVIFDDFLLPADFVILDMLEDSETPILLGRPLLSTCRSLIDGELGDLILRFNKEKVLFNVFEAIKLHKENPQCYRVYVMEDIGERR